MPLRHDIQLQDVEIVTNRLILRPTNITDLVPITREFNERITRYMTPPAAQSSTEVAAFIADSMEGLNNNTNLQLTAVNRERPGKFAGCLGLHNPETRTPELGIWIAEKFHRQGLGLEAIEALCAWAAKEIDCDYLEYPVDKANHPSRRIPESLGAEIEDEYDRITADGRTLNLVEYRIYPETLSAADIAHTTTRAQPPPPPPPPQPRIPARPSVDFPTEAQRSGGTSLHPTNHRSTYHPASRP